MSYADYCSRRNDCDYCHQPKGNCLCYENEPDTCQNCGGEATSLPSLCPIDGTLCNCCEVCRLGCEVSA